MSEHPYPDTIRQAVAKTIGRQILVFHEWDELNWQTQQAFLSDADQVLESVWGASRVDDPEEITEATEWFYVPAAETVQHRDELLEEIEAWDFDFPPIFPAHVIFWGDSQ